MVNVLIAALGLVLTPWLAATAAAGTSDIMGAWQREDGIARVMVAPCGKIICMTNTYIRPDVTDEKVGERIEFDIRTSADSSLTGTVRDPKTGKNYSAVIIADGEQMTTRGCILGGMICKTTKWTRLR